MSIYDTGDGGGTPAPAPASDLTIPDYAPTGGGGGVMEGMGSSAAASSGGGDLMMKVRGDPAMMKKIGAAVGAVVLVVIIYVIATSGGADPNNLTAAEQEALNRRFTFAVAPGRFRVGVEAMSWDEAKTYCEKTYPGGGMASVHSFAEQRQAASGCAAANIGSGWSDTTKANGCWIGLADNDVENDFKWTDNSPVDFLAFAPAEPNECAGASAEGEENCHTAGEDYVEMHIGYNFGWNDNAVESSYGDDTAAASFSILLLFRFER